MVVDRKHLAEGTAWITPDGILFRGLFYSCRRALREGWFTYRGAEGSRSIQVLYDETYETQAVIYIDSEDYREDGLCQLLPDRAYSPDHIASYQERIRCLQEEKKQLLGDK